MVIFWNVYYERNEGKLLLVMSIDNDWMVDQMIIYIKNTIAKALNINDVIKKNEDVCSTTPNLSTNNQIQPPIDMSK